MTVVDMVRAAHTIRLLKVANVRQVNQEPQIMLQDVLNVYQSMHLDPVDMGDLEYTSIPHHKECLLRIHTCAASTTTSIFTGCTGGSVSNNWT